MDKPAIDQGLRDPVGRARRFLWLNDSTSLGGFANTKAQDLPGKLQHSYRNLRPSFLAGQLGPRPSFNPAAF
jgi:hypothetical protein